MRILESMLQLVDERGFEGATIAELARRSGLPASSVYWHFASKDEILAAALSYSYQEKYADRLPWPEMPDARPLDAQLVDALDFLEGDGAEADYIRIGLALSLQRATAATAARATCLAIRQEAQRRLAMWWSSVLGELSPGGSYDPGAAQAMSRLTIAVLDGRYLTGRSVRLTPTHTRVLALVLEGMAAHFAAGGKVAVGSVPLVDRIWVKGSEQGKDALLAAAVDVLCDHGPAGATVARICARAGLPASSLYWHFDDLDDLLTQALDTAFDRWSTQAGDWSVPAGGDHEAALVSTIMGGLAGMLHEPAAFRIGYMLLLQRGESSARQRFRSIRYERSLRGAAAFAEWLGMTMPDGTAAEVAESSLPGMLSWTLMTLCDGLFVVEAVSPGSPDWPVSDVSEVITEGLRHVVTASGAGPA